MQLTNQPISPRARLSKRQEACILFSVAAVFLFLQLLRFGSMISLSGDAADIWQTITTFYTNERYASYVLYKGFFAVYPYVWLYQLAVLLGVNEFTFVMCYHALLFAYICAFGAPSLVRTLTDYEPRFWQRVLLAAVLYWHWSRYYALTQIMVDLPSCAFFLMSAQCAAAIPCKTGWRRWGCICQTGIFCGISAFISGQYSVSALCVLFFSLVQIWKSAPGRKRTGHPSFLPLLPPALLLCLSMFSVRLLNVYFDITVLQPFQRQGIYISSSSSWLYRGLLYFMSIPRNFYGLQLNDPRGYQIIMALYGAEQGTALLETAAAGGTGWTIPEYLQHFFKSPVNFIMLYLNRFMIILSDDCGTGSLRSLLPGYTMIYLSILTAVKPLKRLRDFFCAKTWLVLGVLGSIIPSLVLTVEMRNILSLQVLLFGTALAGPALPQMVSTISGAIRQKEKNESLLDCRFPWAILGWIIFCAVCLAYFGAICAASDAGTAMLYHW